MATAQPIAAHVFVPTDARVQAVPFSAEESTVYTGRTINLRAPSAAAGAIAVPGSMYPTATTVYPKNLVESNYTSNTGGGAEHSLQNVQQQPPPLAIYRQASQPPTATPRINGLTNEVHKLETVTSSLVAADRQQPDHHHQPSSLAQVQRQPSRPISHIHRDLQYFPPKSSLADDTSVLALMPPTYDPSRVPTFVDGPTWSEEVKGFDILLPQQQQRAVAAHLPQESGKVRQKRHRHHGRHRQLDYRQSQTVVDSRHRHQPLASAVQSRGSYPPHRSTENDRWVSRSGSNQAGTGRIYVASELSSSDYHGIPLNVNKTHCC